MLSVLFLFFFSSRRRHTRSKRDWSSDVCSSDLRAEIRSVSKKAVPGHGAGNLGRPAATAAQPGQRDRPGTVAELFDPGRSEERRVGKEWKSQWWQKKSK